jgi:hypothetical protein
MFSGALIAAGLLTSLSGAFLLERCPGIITFASNDVVAATAPVPTAPVRNYQDLHQARYQEAMFHPAVSQPKPHASQHVATSRRIQFLQVREDEDGEGFTLVLYTVEVPAPANWIAFQI